MRAKDRACETCIYTITMDAAVQKVLVDLKIVSLVQSKGRLRMVHDALAVETPSLLTPIKRYLYNDNRHAVCQRIKQRLVELETLLSQRHIEDPWIIEEVAKMLEPLKQGINNLKETYSQDSQVCVHLDLITSRINNLAKIYFTQ